MCVSVVKRKVESGREVSKRGWSVGETGQDSLVFHMECCSNA